MDSMPHEDLLPARCGHGLLNPSLGWSAERVEQRTKYTASLRLGSGQGGVW